MGSKIVMTLFLVLFSIVALGTYFIVTRGAVPKSESIESLESSLRAVDLAAFLNLTDTGETEFLRTVLSPESFRRVARMRIRAALKYLKRLSWNSAVLQKIGEVAARNPDQAIAASGRELANTALRTRILILRAYYKLVPQLVFPSHSTRSDSSLLSDYEELRHRFGALAAVQQPLDASRFLSQL
jgi:hypothetical protein